MNEYLNSLLESVKEKANNLGYDFDVEYERAYGYPVYRLCPKSGGTSYGTCTLTTLDEHLDHIQKEKELCTAKTVRN